MASEGESHLLREDSEVFKMLQENREARVAPRQSSSFRLLQEALEAEERGETQGMPEGRDAPPYPGPLTGHVIKLVFKCPSEQALTCVSQSPRTKGAYGPGGVTRGAGWDDENAKGAIKLVVGLDLQGGCHGGRRV